MQSIMKPCQSLLAFSFSEFLNCAAKIVIFLIITKQSWRYRKIFLPLQGQKENE